MVQTSTLPIGAVMLSRFARHARGNAVSYLALFVALGGTSYAAARLAPGSVTTRALANGAVTSAKLARNSVGDRTLRTHSLTAADFKPPVLADAIRRFERKRGHHGPRGPVGSRGPAGKDGNASIVVTARGTGTVTAPHGAATAVPLTGASWTQAANDLNLITGSMQVRIPSACTGSYGNALVVSLDGIPNTFAVAPTAPASSTVTVPFTLSELLDPGSSTPHTITTKLANTCTKSGEDFVISNVKIDVLKLH